MFRENQFLSKSFTFSSIKLQKKHFASFVVKNALNAIFGQNKWIYSVESIIFIKRDKKNVFF